MAIKVLKGFKMLRSKVFIAHVDEYDSRYIAEHLSNATIGQTLKADDEEAIEEETEESSEKKKESQTYEIYGTLKGEPKIDVPFMRQIVTASSRKALYQEILGCNFIIYNIKEDPDLIDEALWILDHLHENIDSLENQIVFILISTVLTWTKSAPLDENDPEMPYSDDDYLRRKAHPNYKEHLLAEKTVIQQGKSDKTKLLTYVISSGVTYGETENVFHHFFKTAWNNSAYTQVPGLAENIIPTIHVRDLASIVQNVMETHPLKHYILAKDDSMNTIEEIVRAIHKSMSTGKLKFITREEAFLIPDFTQSHIDQLTMSIRMDASYVKEQMHFKWHCETGLVENLSNIVREFKISRKLIPVRLCVLGPPASGKTTLAKKLADYYKIPHLHIKGVLDEALASLRKRVQANEDAPSDRRILQSGTAAGPTTINEEEEEEEQEPGSADAELLEAIQLSMDENNGKMDMEYVTDFFKQKLTSKPCQNQGYILDGYPKSKKQAAALFSGGEEGEDEEQEENEEEEEGESARGGSKKLPTGPSASAQFAAKYLPSETELANVTNEPGLLPTQPIPTQLPKGLLPNYIFELQATDKFLRDRVMNMPESKVYGTHYNEAGLLRRLNEYRSNQLGINPVSPTSLSLPGTTSTTGTEQDQVSPNPMSPLASASINENSIRAYFDTKGVLQIPVNVMTDESKELDWTFKKIAYFVGPPRNYGLTPEELEQQQRLEEEERLRNEQLERDRLQMQIEHEEAARAIRTQEWQTKQSEAEKHEIELLNQEAEPLRAYLRKFIMPVLAQGLSECVQKRPDDPIDFLAEYLFFNNPQVD